MRGATSSPFYALILLRMVKGENTEEFLQSRNLFLLLSFEDVPVFSSGVEIGNPIKKLGNTNFCLITRPSSESSSWCYLLLEVAVGSSSWGPN